MGKSGISVADGLRLASTVRSFHAKRGACENCGAFCIAGAQQQKDASGTDGTVIARAPLRMPKDRILCFLSEKASWIRMQQGKMQEREKMRQQARIHLDAAQEKELRERAKSVLAQRTAYFARQVGVTYGRITVRDQKTRWGSCSQTGNLNFNFRLILAPLEVLDYVVVHELCHRRQMNHSTQFWQEVAQVLPDYRKRKAWLTENGWRLMG